MDMASLVRSLADGQWHRVDDAGQCQALLYQAGLTTEVSPDGRCRLTQAIELLDATRISTALIHSDRVTVDVAGIVDSTNTQLLTRAAPVCGRGEVLLAEYQNAGRGRQGRFWLSPYGGGLCLSMAWQFRPVPRQPGCLSLAVGVALLRALAGHGVNDIRLKWPNDLLYDNRKLAGVLIDVSRTDDSLHVVAGIGINLALTMPDHARIEVAGGVRAVALNEIDTALAARRNALAALVIDNMAEAFVEFQQKGFEPFQQEYNLADVLKGCAVQVTGPASSLDGQAIGIDDTGALLVRAGEMTHRLFSGDVRVRI